jgi:hypothetical protein
MIFRPFFHFHTCMWPVIIISSTCSLPFLLYFIFYYEKMKMKNDDASHIDVHKYKAHLYTAHRIANLFRIFIENLSRPLRDFCLLFDLSKGEIKCSCLWWCQGDSWVCYLFNLMKLWDHHLWCQTSLISQMNYRSFIKIIFKLGIMSFKIISYNLCIGCLNVMFFDAFAWENNAIKGSLWLGW